MNCDEGQIRQVINNIVVNAMAMLGGGEITVTVENIELMESYYLMPLEAGHSIKLSIEDQGTGITVQDQPRIFDPFFSTKPTCNGLGLVTTYSIIQQHSG